VTDRRQAFLSVMPRTASSDNRQLRQQVTTGGDAVVAVIAVVTSTASNIGSSAVAIRKSIITGMSNLPSRGSTITVVPRVLIKNPAMPSQRRTVPSPASNASHRTVGSWALELDVAWLDHIAATRTLFTSRETPAC
jgi:hypothetical protein